ncbi:MAG: hypothetical protein ACI38Q_01430 [Candidatus Bruticola sp.]
MKKANWATFSIATACLIMTAGTVYTLLHMNDNKPINGHVGSAPNALTESISNLNRRSFAEALVAVLDQDQYKTLLAKQDDYKKHMLSAKYAAKCPKGWLLNILVDSATSQLYSDFVSPPDMKAHIIVVPYGGFDIPIERVNYEFILQNFASIPDLLSSEVINERNYTTSTMQVSQQTLLILRDSKPVSRCNVNVACVRSLKKKETYIVMLSAPEDKFTQALSVYTRFLTTLRPSDNIANAPTQPPTGEYGRKKGHVMIEPQGTPEYHPHKVAPPGAPGGKPVPKGVADPASGVVHETKGGAALGRPNASSKAQLTDPNKKAKQTVNIYNNPKK